MQDSRDICLKKVYHLGCDHLTARKVAEHFGLGLGLGFRVGVRLGLGFRMRVKVRVGLISTEVCYIDV